MLFCCCFLLCCYYKHIKAINCYPCVFGKVNLFVGWVAGLLASADVSCTSCASKTSLSFPQRPCLDFFGSDMLSNFFWFWHAVNEIFGSDMLSIFFGSDMLSFKKVGCFLWCKGAKWKCIHLRSVRKLPFYVAQSLLLKLLHTSEMIE